MAPITTRQPPVVAHRNRHQIACWAAGRFFCTATLLCLLVGPVTAAPKFPEKEFILAKHYVLAACVVARYPGTPLAKEADAWAGVLVEEGSLGAAAYPALSKLGHSAPAPAATQFGVVLRLASCAEFVARDDVAAKIRSAMGR